MMWLIIISFIVISIFGIVLIKNSTNASFNVYKTNFTSLSNIHSDWANSTITKVNKNLKKLKVISKEELNQYLDILYKNTDLQTIYECDETINNDVINYSPTLKNDCNDFYLEMKLSYVKDGDIVSYNVNKTSVKFNTNMNVYWYKHSLSYVNNNDINVNSFLYAKLENNKFVEIPMVIKAKVYPYELKTKQGTMNYNLK